MKRSERTTMVTLIITCSLLLLFYWCQHSFPNTKSAAEDRTTFYYYRERTLSISRAIENNIKRNCANLGIGTQWDLNTSSLPAHLLAQESTHIVYGALAKSGSSSFKHFLYHTEGDTCDPPCYPHAADENGQYPHWDRVEDNSFFVSEEDLESYVKIAPIRNPIVRLVSAFRDKQLMRFAFLPEEEVAGFPDSKMFVYFIEKLFVQRGKNDIINKEEHLQPQWKNLEICSFPYDIVMPIEHPDHSIKLLQELTDTTHITFPHKVPGSKLRGKKVGHPVHRSTADFAREYFSSLSTVQLEAVMLHYKLDFEILGYTGLHQKGFPELNICADPSIQKCW